MRIFLLVISLFLLKTSQAGLRYVDFDPRPGAQLPLAVLLHEAGRPVRLERFFGRAPVVLQLGYLGCLNLCSTALASTSAALTQTGLAPGRDYIALFVSIDARDEKAPPERRDGWHVLTGAAPAAALARSVGFRFAYEEQSGQFAHPAGFVVLTPEGTVARYFPGVHSDPGELRRALESAARGERPGAFERLLLVCFHDPVSGAHSETILWLLKLLAALLAAGLALLVWRCR